ncbi:cyclin-domain-containing protein [Mycena floridula]|nr:cyclin-domain-containing protein [Mycena floridula]
MDPSGTHLPPLLACALSTPTSTLTFHARNVPTISLEAYLHRILKYCPTTNEVFLSLLVYFDRMSKMNSEATGRTFVIDSFNIHRLVIAGVTVASKFFSDVFYTNSRYAKVGGLPQSELNQLELHFLLLNDFRLVIPQDEMQRYAEQLIAFSNSPTAGSLDTVSPQPHIPVSTPSAFSSAGSFSGAVATPTHTMGAFDAYGGHLPGETSSVYGAYSGHPKAPDAPQSSFAPIQRSSPSRFSQMGKLVSEASKKNETDETETETETETDGGWTTDDEPTIRPPHSSAGSSEDSRSICSNSDVGDDGADPEDDVGFGD